MSHEQALPSIGTARSFSDINETNKELGLLAAHGLDSALWESPAGRAALPTWRRCLGEPIELQARNATLAPGGCVARRCAWACSSGGAAGIGSMLARPNA